MTRRSKTFAVALVALTQAGCAPVLLARGKPGDDWHAWTSATTRAEIERELGRPVELFDGDDVADARGAFAVGVYRFRLTREALRGQALTEIFLLELATLFLLEFFTLDAVLSHDATNWSAVVAGFDEEGVVLWREPDGIDEEPGFPDRLESRARVGVVGTR